MWMENQSYRRRGGEGKMIDKLKTNRKWQACVVVLGIMTCAAVVILLLMIDFSKRMASSFEEITHWTRSLEWSPDGTLLAAGFDNGCAAIWNPDTGEEIRYIENIKGAVRGLDWSPDSSFLLLGNDTNSGFAFWDPNTGEKFNTRPMGNSLGYLAISPDSQLVALSGGGYQVLILDLKTAEPVNELSGKHSSWITGLVWSNDNSRIATSSADGKLVIWEARSGQAEQILNAHLGWVNALDWSPDGKAIATGGDDLKVKIWDPNTGEIMQTLNGHLGSVYGVAWSPDGKRLASAAVDERVTIWESETGSALKTIEMNGDGAIVLAWSGDGARLAVGTENETVQILDATTGELIRTLPSPCLAGSD
jgi:WD40 repeat protein